MSPVRSVERGPGGARPRLDGARLVEGRVDRGRGLRIALAVSRFNERITDRLLDGAWKTLRASGVEPSGVTVVFVPGAYELPFAARRLAASGRHDAVACLGSVIRGATPHFEHVAGVAARGIARASEETGVPVLFGVLTTDTLRQALDRSGGRLGNRGADAAAAAVEMAQVARELRKRTRRRA